MNDSLILGAKSGEFELLENQIPLMVITINVKFEQTRLDETQYNMEIEQADYLNGFQHAMDINGIVFYILERLNQLDGAELEIIIKLLNERPYIIGITI